MLRRHTFSKDQGWIWGELKIMLSLFNHFYIFTNTSVSFLFCRLKKDMHSYLFELFLFSLFKFGLSFPKDVYKSNYKYIEQGDINIGAVLSVHTSTLLMKCSGEIRDTRNIQNVEALHFAVNEINNNTDILPGLKLGFIALDDCQLPEMALARAVQFMPRRISGFPDRVKNVTSSADLFYDVAGVIGPYTSKLSIIVADVLNLWQLPQISQTATSDALSDKTRFPYFFRMVPPDRYQVKVIASLLQHFNWTHISIVYSEGSYGREGLKELREILKTAAPSVCIEDTIEIVYQSGSKDFLQVMQRLDNNKDVRIVVAYIELEDAVSLSNALIGAKLQNRFVWLGSDSISITLDDQPERCRSFHSLLSVEPQKGEVRNFRNYLARLSTRQAQSNNPWLTVLMKHSTKTNIAPNLQLADHDENYLKKSFGESYIIDSVYAFAHALDNVVRKNCPGRKNKAALVKCVMDVGIFDELKSLQFNGSFGTVKFNDHGDVISKYDIKQCINIGSHVRTYKVGHWDMSDEQLFLDNTELFWPGKAVPKSACPEPCWKSTGKIFHYQQRTCCWECLSCKQNEIVTMNLTKCECCPNFHWPDISRKSCVRIAPFYMSFAEPIAIGLGVASVTGILVCLLIGTALLKYRNEQVIKCTSVELSFLVLIGAFLAYCLPISFLSKPNVYKCYINHVGFSLTFTIVYAPLLVKTNRIYRIFKSGRRTTRKPFCISKASQILIAFTLVIFQVRLNIFFTNFHNGFGHYFNKSSLGGLCLDADPISRILQKNLTHNRKDIQLIFCIYE